ncbi:unnamed protein product, partial [marine sediment metagenome]
GATTIPTIGSEAPSILQQAIEHYRPGGEFAATRAEQLRGRERVVTAGMEAGLVGRGLAGTTVGAAIPAAVEQQVSAPWRTETEMLRGARLMEAVLAQAGFTERQTAREQEVAIANAQMELQERLANRQISVQEYNAAMNALSKTGGAGGGGGAVAGRTPAGAIPRVYVPGLGMTTAGGQRDPSGGGAGGDAGYGRHLLDSLEGDADGAGGGGGGSPALYNPARQYIGPMDMAEAQKQAALWPG